MFKFTEEGGGAGSANSERIGGDFSMAAGDSEGAILAPDGACELT
jgi:hypothetical protein